VIKRAFAIILGSFQLENSIAFPQKLPEWHEKQALSPLATEALQKRTVCSRGDPRWRGK
jgi:hypothetical protein